MILTPTQAEELSANLTLSAHELLLAIPRDTPSKHLRQSIVHIVEALNVLEIALRAEAEV